ncbi:MAG: biotin--[acetyl-CoA-carboxylase] ligase [Actinomycetota bacterium]
MDTPIATSDDENLPGVPFADRPVPVDSEAGIASRGLETAGIVGETWTLRWVETTGSTNSDLVQAAFGGGPHGLVLVADHQTAGRGRLDRRWEAPHGANLLMSVLIRRLPASVHQVTQAVAVAAAEACEAVVAARGRQIEVDLKWPNDVLIDGRKLAGILATVGSASEAAFVVVGLGLNIGWAPEGAVALREVVEEREVSRDEVLREVLERLDGHLSGAAGELFERYRSRLTTLGREVRVELPTGEFLEGRAVGVEDDGRLVVLDSCAITHRLDVGDIVHLR